MCLHKARPVYYSSRYVHTTSIAVEQREMVSHIIVVLIEVLLKS